MTLDEVQSLVRVQSVQSLSAINDHRITLANALVPPKALTVIWRATENGRLKDEELHVWLVGQEDSSPDGYKIILRDDGKQYGLASSGFPSDKHLILVGWYGSLLSAFMAM
jgi:hypothetical protein